MKSIFNNDAYQELQNRLDKLSADNQAQWGKMNVNQMLKHCQKVIQVALGEIDINRPNIVIRLIMYVLRPTLYNNKPWKKGLPTAKSFVIKNTDEFETEKSKLRHLISRIHESKKHFEPSKKHPVFGKMKSWMWGQSAYKHLNHHFNQFGV